MKKRVIVFFLLFALLFSTTAFAEEPQFVTTRNFLLAADTEKGIAYTLGTPITDANGTHYDLVRLTYQGDASPYTSNITLLFHESQDRVQLMMYNLINFAEEDRTAVLDEINMLNRGCLTFARHHTAKQKNAENSCKKAFHYLIKYKIDAKIYLFSEKYTIFAPKN